MCDDVKEQLRILIDKYFLYETISESHLNKNFLVQISVLTQTDDKWILHCPFIWTFDKKRCEESIIDTSELVECSNLDSDIFFESLNESYEGQYFDIEEIENFYDEHLKPNQIRVKSLYSGFENKNYKGKVKTKYILAVL